ncbi:MAG: hypothetical protein J7L26_05540 [Candidatus Aminicenantes bacterium]|nr:hypothetical protein [Candidatus Aminicenantes bacterium]
MKKHLLLLVLILSLAGLGTAAKLPLRYEAGGGLAISEGNNSFYFEGSVLIKVYQRFFVRAGLFNLNLASGSNTVSLGTGLGLDLVYFFSGGSFQPYGLGGFTLVSGGGVSTANLKVGGGLEFSRLLKGKMRPFVEGSFSLYSISSGGSSSSSNQFTIGAGVRF